jgi:hypothetical protein
MTKTNIKNLPEGKYFSEIGYSQSYPWVEIKRTAKTVTLARVEVYTDPEWTAKKEFSPGGFCGHCSNQEEQTWLFAFINDNHTITIRNTKRGWSHKGVAFYEDRAFNFYDYNF